MLVSRFIRSFWAFFWWVVNCSVRSGLDDEEVEGSAGVQDRSLVKKLNSYEKRVRGIT